MKNRIVVFVVLGRLGKGLGISKVIPILNSDYVNKVYIFSDKVHLRHPKASFILLPDFFNEKNSVKKVLRFLYEPFQLIYYAFKYKPHIINGVFTIPKGYNSYLASRLSGSKNIISILGNTNEIAAWIKYTSIVKKIHLWFYKHTDVVTTKGNKITNYLIDHNIHNDKIFVFNGAIDTKRFRTEERTRDVDILFVGKFSELKGPDRVVEVITKLKQDIPEIKAVFLGEGPLFELVKTKVKEYNLGQNITLPGYSDKTEEYFQRSKLLLMPSRSEGLSTAMLEAMACGCVPIVTNVGSMTEAAHHEINSMVINDFNDVNRFYKYSKTLLLNGTKRSELAENGIDFVDKNYAVNAQVKVFNKMVDYLRIKEN